MYWWWIDSYFLRKDDYNSFREEEESALSDNICNRLRPSNMEWWPMVNSREKNLTSRWSAQIAASRTTTIAFIPSCFLISLLFYSKILATALSGNFPFFIYKKLKKEAISLESQRRLIMGPKICELDLTYITQ